jgi:hypothetical protein
MAQGLTPDSNQDQVRRNNDPDQEIPEDESLHSTTDEELPTEEEDSDDEDLFAPSDTDDQEQENQESEEDSDDKEAHQLIQSRSPFIHPPRNPRVFVKFRSIFCPRHPEDWTLDYPLHTWVTRLTFWLKHLNSLPGPSIAYFAKITYCQNFQHNNQVAFLHPVAKKGS